MSKVINISIELIWLIVGIIFLISEIFIPGLVIAFFGIGALITSLTTWLRLTTSFQLQIIVFSGSSVILLLILRKFLTKIFQGKIIKNEEVTSFNLEVEKIVPVTELIQPGEIGGKVRYHGALWSARSSETITPGESAAIVGCDSLTLIVEKINKEAS